MRRPDLISPSRFPRFSLGIAFALSMILVRPLGHAAGIAPGAAVALALALLVPLGLVVLHVPRGLLRRWRAVRRDRALFRGLASRSRQASIICEPVRASTGAVTDFCILYTNRRGARLFGPGAGQGKTLLSLLPPPDFRDTMQTWLRVLQTAQPEVARVTVRGRSGKKTTCEVHVVPQSGCLVVTTLQSHEEQAAHRQVEELHDFTRAVFESAPVGIIATDANGIVIAMNEGAEKLTGFLKRELVGKHSLLRLHDPDEIGRRAADLRRLAGKPLRDVELLLEHRKWHEKDDWTYLRRDGSTVCVHLTLTPLHTDGGLTGYLAVAFDVTERKQLADTAFYMAHHDQLTGLPNRTLVRPSLEAAVASARECGGTGAIFAIDIDHFKRINDSLGHAGGDAVLTTVAARLSATIRTADFAARLGGDEFVVICSEIRSAANAEVRACALLESIARPFQVGQREVRVTASIGYCLFPAAAGSADDLLHDADLAMYAAKSAGRGRFAPFSDALQRATQGRLEMEEDLRHALERGEFLLHYQPQVTCASGNVESVEMLLRWNSAKRGNVPPDVFIPVAQEAGLMFDIGAWSLNKACHDCAAAQLLLQRRLRVAVNLSSQQIQQPELFSVVQQALRESGLPPENLELEITEQVLMTATPCVLATLDRIRKLGISLAIDDFGTGFSSFAYLLEYKVDRLKIDRSFVSQAATDSNAAAIVRTVIAMAHGLGLKVCAEGAETEPQINFLLRRHCDEIQGFFFARPVPFSDLQSAVSRIEQPDRKCIRATPTGKRRGAIPFPSTTLPAAENARPRLHA